MPKQTPISGLEGFAIQQDNEWTILDGYVSSFDKRNVCYLAGNSLGLQPEGFKEKLLRHASIWENEQHNGHFFTDGSLKDRPWWRYQEKSAPTAARLLGARLSKEYPEVALFNTLSVNNRNLIETFAMGMRDNILKDITPAIITIKSNFPSDDVGLKYALKVVLGKKHKLIEIAPDSNGLYDFKNMVEIIRNTPHLIMGFFPGLCYTTGQRFPIRMLTYALHEKLAVAGFDLAHSVGNYQLQLHDDGVDFATFCGYKYLNGGPGAVGGIFVHERWFSEKVFSSIKDYVSGWFGIHKDDRFNFDPNNYRAAPGAWGFVQSNDQIFNMQGVEASFELIEEHGMDMIFLKQEKISTFMYACLSAMPEISIITPKSFSERGCQISFRVPGHSTDRLVEALNNDHNFCEQRGDFVRVAPVAYNTFFEVWSFCNSLWKIIS